MVGNRFIVCGKYDNGLLRVMDTNDYTVEPATVEQVKLLQLMGHQISFDNNADYIYRLFDNFSEVTLKQLPSHIFDGIGKYFTDFYYVSCDMGILIYSESKMVLISIRRKDSSYKMIVSSDIMRFVCWDSIDDIQLRGWVKKKAHHYGVQYRHNGVYYVSLFDLNCSYKGMELVL